MDSTLGKDDLVHILLNDFWVHLILTRRRQQLYHSHFRMHVGQFEELLTVLTPHLKKQRSKHNLVVCLKDIIYSKVL